MPRASYFPKLTNASHGEAISDLWQADHLDAVGHDLDPLSNGTPKNFDYLEKYDEIITRISSLKKPRKVASILDGYDKG